MDQKPVIQYVGQFYVYGSEVKAKKKNEPRLPLLPKLKKTREHKIYIDPVAVGGIVLAVAVLIAMVVGAIQLTGCMADYNRANQTLSDLKRDNALLEHAYRTSLDLDALQSRAEELGLVPESEAAHAYITVTVPEKAHTPNAWENFVWFLSGLLGGTETGE